MSLIQTISDVDNTFLARRELTCNFGGLAGRLQKLEAVDMIAKEFKLDDKVIIPIRLKTHVGEPSITGTFYIYDDEGLAKKHVNPTVFSRLEKAKTKLKEADEAKADAKPGDKAGDAAKDAKPGDAAKPDDKAGDAAKDAKTGEAQ